jgi:hypothetical protein
MYDNNEWKLVKYIKIVPREFRENLELKFKDIVRPGNGIKKELVDKEEVFSNYVSSQKSKVQ